jgi:hypothetical protein
MGLIGFVLVLRRFQTEICTSNHQVSRIKLEIELDLVNLFD